ncbi:protein yellow-like [Hylaeus anthracinus]|uniref:protein yellow-like n=1 Tax=Hylaeus anthracinus TaxID=313031 RepID=UPI0023B98AD1|nr:protein yellow-like [Hylaeus anthracinus]
MQRLFLIAFLAVASGQQFETLYTWDFVDFNFPNDSLRETLISSGDYVPENNMPLGLHLWEDKIFITVPRWKNGVVSNLNYFSKDDKSKSPKLNPYPNWELNDIQNPDAIVSIFRVRADACGRLWGVDTGIDDILGNTTVVQPVRIFVFDLKTDKVLRTYTLKDSDQTPNSFFADLVVDVDENNCDDAYLYTSDLGGYGMVVYSWAKNDSWRISHNFFHFDPVNGNFNISGFNFQWTDGVFGMSLSPPQKDGYKTLYFHAMSGITEFSVSTEVLQDNTLAKSGVYEAFHIEGNKGPNTQGPSSLMDQKCGINYFTQVHRNGIACWDTSVKLTPDTFVLVAQDNTTMVFPNDLSIDASNNMLYVLSDNLPKFLLSRFDAETRNFFLTAASLDKLTPLCKKQNS